MNINHKPNKNIAIIGTGLVGSTTAYTLMQSGLTSEIVLIDVNMDKAKGEEMDLAHGMPFVHPTNIYAGTYSDCAHSDIIIITAGLNQKPSESRIDLVYKNTEVFKTIINEISKYAKDCILLAVTNPVDVLTYVTYKLSGFSKNKVIGSGTVLDSARFRYLLSEHTSIDARNIHAYVLGEHGDTEVPIWSTANIAGIPMEDYCNMCNKCENHMSKYDISSQVKNAAYEIIKRKGSTYYAVALATKKIIQCIIRDEHSVLTVSSFVQNEYPGICDVCLSLPTIVDKDGINKILPTPISEEESQSLIKSADTLRNIIKQIKL